MNIRGKAKKGAALLTALMITLLAFAGCQQDGASSKVPAGNESGEGTASATETH